MEWTVVLSNLPARIDPQSFAGYQLQNLLQIFLTAMDTVLFSVQFYKKTMLLALK